MGKWWFSMGFYGIYPLVNVYITMERSTNFDRKTDFFDWAIFNSYIELPSGYLAKLWMINGALQLGTTSVNGPCSSIFHGYVK